MAGLVNAIFEISLSTSVIIAVLLLISPLLAKNYSAKSLCIIWLVLSLRLTIPFTYHAETTVINIPAPVQKITVTVPGKSDGTTASGGQVLDIVQGGPGNDLIASPQVSSGQVPFDAVIALIWAAGTFTFLAIHFAGYVSLQRNIRRLSKPIKNSKVLGMFYAVLNDMNIRQGRIRIFAYPKGQSPMMTGFFRPLILLPDSSDYAQYDLELIFRHELVHYKRMDIWFKLFLICANAMHWFNPLAYLMVREANKQIENACDYEIVRNSDMQLRKKYSESILSAMSQDFSKRLGLSTYFHGGKKTMTQRFKNIFDFKSKRPGVPVIVAILLVVLLSGLLVACQSQTGTNPSPSADASDSPSVTDTSSITDTPSSNPSATTGESGQIEELAKTWAEAVKNRDGKAQYELMTKALQEKVYDEFEGLNWVTGTSSPWVVSYTVTEQNSGARVTFEYATSTGPVGSYYQDLTFKTEDGALKIDSISELQAAISPSASPSASTLSFTDLIGLIGMSKDELLKAVPEQPVPVDEGGLGFDKTGIRVWFDAETYSKVAQVLIMTNQIDINGVKVGDSYDAFKTVFGTPVSDQNGDAHFKYGDIFLSVVRDTSTGNTIAVYILAENF